MRLAPSISEQALPEAAAPANARAKLALGTVQWGMSYGIAGRGQPSAAEVGDILALGKRAGITMLDTAHVYGSAEKVIGAQDTAGMRIVTKTLKMRPSRIESAEIAAVEAALEDSFARLQQASVYAVLVHDADNLLIPGADRLWKLLERYRDAGRIGRIGVSVYDPAQCRAVASAFPVEIVQLPFNVYDRRFRESGVLSELKARAVEVHARSAFLQGLLLMSPESLPRHFDAIRGHHARLHAWFGAHNMSALAGSLHFCLQEAHVDRVVVGCETAAQLGEILDAAAAEAPSMLQTPFALTDPNIIEPTRWPK